MAVIRGRPGAGRRTLAAALAASANRQLAIVDVGRHLRGGSVRAEVVRAALLQATQGGWLPCADGLDVVAGEDRSGRELARDILRRHPGPLTIRLGADVTPPLDPGYVLVDLPTLTETRRMAIWRDTLASHHIDVPDVQELAARWVVGPGVVHRVAQTVARELSDGHRRVDGASDLTVQIDSAVRQHLESRLGDVAVRVKRLAHWSQIVLPGDLIDSLLEFVGRVRHRRVVYEDWGLGRAVPASHGLTALFQGGPGTGKTLVAGAIARDLGLDLYRIDTARVVSKWIGETERNLAQVFDAAEDGQAVLLFDEADSLFAKRTEVKSSVDRYANLEVNYLLQRLDACSSIAILTTNLAGSIDAAFKRRLTLQLSFPFPDEEMRERLWRVHLPRELTRGSTLKLDDLARRYQLSGGYIRNAAVRAAFLAAAEGSRLRQDHLERAVKAEYREMGKLSDSGALE